MLPDEKGPHAQEHTDEQLVDLVKSGELAAFDQLVLRYQERLYGVLYNMTSNHEDTNDLLMEVFDKAFRSINSYKKNSSFYTWIYRIGVNRTLNHLRKNKKFKKNFSLNDIDPENSGDFDLPDTHHLSNPEKNTNISELQKKLNESLQKLSEHHRAVVVLHDIDGLSHRDIAGIMNCTEGTVRSRLHYAHKNLKKLLAKHLE